MAELSQRHHDVLRWACEGKTAEETGIILGLSTPTVSGYRCAATRKLDAANLTQACVQYDRAYGRKEA